MQYVLLIYDEEGSGEIRPGAPGFDARAAGALIASERLHPVATATSVRVRDGDTEVRDGPFAETKESLGGFCLIDADSLDEAIEWAAAIPSARSGTIEIRPVRPSAERGG